MLPSSDIVSSGTYSSPGWSSPGGAQSGLKADACVFPESIEL